MSYKESLTEAMGMLAKHPKTLFVGQSVCYGGQAMFPTLRDVPMERRIEFPVAEDFQMGFCTGLALEGYIPISIYPRFDFLLLAANQLVNHLDKIPLMGGFRPKVLIRTAVGSRSPLNAGPQHTQDHTEAFNLMLRCIHVIKVVYPLSAYQSALSVPGPVLLVEDMEKYYE